MKRMSTTKTLVISDDDAPALTQARFDRAQFRVDGRPADRAEWQAAVRGRITKQRISIMLDAPIVAHYKAVAGERGYQTLINDTLRRAVEAEHFMQDIRTAIREELAELGTAKK